MNPSPTPPPPPAASSNPPPAPGTPPPPPPTPAGPSNAGDLAGKTLDRYTLETLLGEGGMGRVYSAVHTVTLRRCALKLLPDELSRNPDFVHRFRSEAQMLAKLNHPNIVQIYTGGEADSRFFLEMEYIDGGDLQKRVTQLTVSGGKALPEAEAYKITHSVLSALKYAHSKGIIHRDLKPANILLSQDGSVKVSDFGLAAVVGEEHHRSLVQSSMTSFTLAKVTSMETVAVNPATESSSFAGTILYMSPQALRAEPPDHRDDLFSLGIVVYYMLTGRTPSVNYTPVSKLRPDLKHDWDRFITTCLAEERTARFKDASAALSGLEQLGSRRTKWYVLAGVAAVLAVTAVGAVVGRPYLFPAKSTAGSSAKTQAIRFQPIAAPKSPSQPVLLAANATSGLPVEFEVLSGPGKILNSFLVPTGPGKVVVRARQTGDARYAAAAPLEQAIDFPGAGGEPPNGSGQPPSGGAAASSGGAAQSGPSGSATQSSAAGVVSGPVQRPQTITLEGVPTKALVDTPPEIEARSDSGLPVRLSVVSGPAVVRKGQLRLTGPGRVTVRAEQPGDANYLAAEPVEAAFDVEEALPARLTVELANGVKLEFVRVPPGQALLGSPVGEIGRQRTERQYQYVERDGFLMLATEVTQAQFEALTGARPSFFRADWATRPVEQIRLSDIGSMNTGATAGFLPKLNAYLQEHDLGAWLAVLPDDGEWEYACRAGSSTAFNNNTDLTVPIVERDVREVAVFGTNETAAVATRKPNAWGLYDMHGNVAEWTREGHLRGGSFRDPPADCRAASLLAGQAGNTVPDRRFGFRVILRRLAEQGR